MILLLMLVACMFVAPCWIEIFEGVSWRPSLIAGLEEVAHDSARSEPKPSFTGCDCRKDQAEMSFAIRKTSES
jgi:hypothetical protein